MQPEEAAAVFEFHLDIPELRFYRGKSYRQHFAVGEYFRAENVLFPLLGVRRADVDGVYVIAGAIDEDEILRARKGGRCSEEQKCRRENNRPYAFDAVQSFRPLSDVNIILIAVKIFKSLLRLHEKSFAP